MSALALAAMSLAVSSLPSDTTTGTVLVARGLTGLLFFAPLAVHEAKGRWPAPNQLRWGLLRALCATASIAAFYVSSRRLPVAVARSLADSHPIFVLLFSLVLRLESPSGWRFAGVALGGASVLLVGASSVSGETPFDAVAVGLAGAATAALGLVSLRKAVAQLPESLVLVTLHLTLLLLGLPTFHLPGTDLSLLCLLLVSAVAGVGRQYFLTESVKYLAPSTVAMWSAAPIFLLVVAGSLLERHPMSNLEGLAVVLMLLSIFAMGRGAAR